jgi:hypothetical protein
MLHASLVTVCRTQQAMTCTWGSGSTGLAKVLEVQTSCNKFLTRR